ncbi:MAG: cation transporter [Lachnospiraceae bacterium]|nr:cation transporter [Lachnospiraceae bacterium]
MSKLFILEDLDCAHCAEKIEQETAKITGVLKSKCTLLTQKLKLDLEEGADELAIVKEVKSIVAKFEPDVTVIEK